MIRIDPKPQVLAALTAAFPKPPRSAERALAKYCRVLEGLVFASLNRGRTPEQQKLNLFGVSLELLANKGGRIGKDKTRVHQWLRENNWELVKTVIQGTSQSRKVSDVKLTDLVTFTNLLETQPDSMKPEIAANEIDAYLTGDSEANAELCALLYPDLADLNTEEQILERFDPLRVNTKSLANYIEWLSTQATKINASRKSTALHQARVVLGVATEYDGCYLQRKKPSEFGRMYYEGISVQNVNRDLRRAILGDCWEYDIRSSVITWKMGFAVDYLTSQRVSEPEAVRREFRSTLAYIEDRDDFMTTVRRSVFSDPEVTTTADFQKQLLKQAFTAISFGARATSCGWSDGSGGITNSAIVDILRNADQRKKFLADPCVRDFIREQNSLDQYIFGLVKSQRPDLLKLPDLQTPSGRPSRSRVLAYLYQHDETMVMGIVTETAAKHERMPIARVHDAIFFRRRLGPDLKWEIEQEMREKTGNPYWRLAAKQLEGFRSLNRDQIREEQEHRTRIAAETERALNYRGAFPTIDGVSTESEWMLDS